VVLQSTTPSHPQFLDDDNLLNAAISPELGSIKVQMRKVISVPSRRQQPVWLGDSFESKVLHERSKKAMGHSVQSVLFPYIGHPFSRFKGSVLHIQQ
jgi:hypothetical protein